MFTGISLILILSIFLRNYKIFASAPLLLLTSFIFFDPILSFWTWERLPNFIFTLKYLAIIIVGYEMRNLQPDSIQKYLEIFVSLVIATGILGFILDKSIYLNGADRYMGLTASPASFAIYSSIACIYLIEKIRQSSASKDLLKLIIVISLLYITHSRQPLIAVLIYFLLRAPMPMKLITIASVVVLFTQVEIKVIRTLDFVIRITQNISGGLDSSHTNLKTARSISTTRSKPKQAHFLQA